MKYRRSDHATYATLASLALALTLTACTPAGPDASAPLAPVSEEVSATSEPSAEPLASLPSMEADNASIAASEEALASETAEPPALEPTVVAPIVATPPAKRPVPVPAAPASPVVTPPVATTPAPPAPTPVTPVVPSTPHTPLGYPMTGTYTFPDGHISFDLPTGWSAKIEQDDYNENADNPGGKENSLAANIFDETGGKVARITSGGTGGLVGGPVNRTILDSQGLSAFDSLDGASHFAFVRDDYPFPEFPVRYYMGVVSSFFMTEGPDSTSVNSFMIMPNGLATAVAEIDASMTPETAEAWMKTNQYVKLRELLTSLRYAA